MAQDCILLLVLLALLQIKHMFADFFMQTPRMLSGRGTYFHIGRAQHAAVHAVGSFAIFIVMGVAAVPALAVAFAEWVIHFHIDWAKGRYSERHPKTPVESGYWYVFGLDQIAHQFTYLAMAAAYLMIRLQMG
ncbi:MAG: DUF3307 domain-containing protein [Marinibacterium sp.]|nr:DUF3307 domain-containing protein [Marinibacterium sp.]